MWKNVKCSFLKWDDQVLARVVNYDVPQNTLLLITETKLLFISKIVGPIDNNIPSIHHSIDDEAYIAVLFFDGLCQDVTLLLN